LSLICCNDNTKEDVGHENRICLGGAIAMAFKIAESSHFIPSNRLVAGDGDEEQAFALESEGCVSTWEYSFSWSIIPTNENVPEIHDGSWFRNYSDSAC
jgi:hypothetical protein